MLSAFKKGIFDLMIELRKIDETDILPGGLSRVKQINDAYLTDMMLVLATIDSANIEALIKGRPHEFHLQQLPEDVPLRLPMSAQAEIRPTIYLHYLVDNTDHPPTPQEWRSVLNAIEDHYIVGYEDHLNNVTPIIPPDSLDMIKKIERQVGQPRQGAESG